MRLTIAVVAFALLARSAALEACADHRETSLNELIVTESSVNFSSHDGHNAITTIATLKNLSQQVVENVYVEVRYFDSQKKQVDVTNQSLFGTVIPATSEVSVRIRDIADKPKAAYASSTVRITSAENRIIRRAQPRDSESKFWVDLFVSWAPMLLLIGVWVLFMIRHNKKGSPQVRLVELVEQQNSLQTRQIEILGRLATAAEKATNQKQD